MVWHQVRWLHCHKTAPNSVQQLVEICIQERIEDNHVCGILNGMLFVRPDMDGYMPTLLSISAGPRWAALVVQQYLPT